MFRYIDNVSIDGAMINGSPFVRLRMPPEADWLTLADASVLALQLEETIERMRRLAVAGAKREEASALYDRLDFDPTKVSPDLLETLKDLLNPPDESA